MSLTLRFLCHRNRNTILTVMQCDLFTPTTMSTLDQSKCVSHERGGVRCGEQCVVWMVGMSLAFPPPPPFVFLPNSITVRSGGNTCRCAYSSTDTWAQREGGRWSHVRHMCVVLWVLEGLLYTVLDIVLCVCACRCTSLTSTRRGMVRETCSSMWQSKEVCTLPPAVSHHTWSL